MPADLTLNLVATDRAYRTPIRRHYKVLSGGELVATVSGSSASGWNIVMEAGDPFSDEDATLVNTLQQAKEWITRRMEKGIVPKP